MQLQLETECLMEGNCQVNDVFYKCDITITRPLSREVCLGNAEGDRKSRFYLSIKHKRDPNKTTRSSYMWHLKSVSSETPNLKWSVLR